MKSRLKLTDREWRVFFLPDLFTPIKGNQNHMASLSEGVYPLVSAKRENNGVKGFVAPNAKGVLPGHCITLNLDGDGGAGLAFYQAHPFALDSHVAALYPKNTQSRYGLLFAARCLSAQHARFGHGRAINRQRLHHFPLMLPSLADGTPDWAFMEAYMRQMENALLGEALRKLDRHLLEPIAALDNLEHRAWREFSFSEVFTQIQRGKRLKRDDHIPGNMPYISSTASSNGLDGFIGNTERVRTCTACISLANSGSVGSAFYQQYTFVASDHITTLKRDGADKYIYLFMIPIIGRLSEKYSFNREINDTRISRETLLLPITADGTPDWQFMSAFMKRIEREVLRETLMQYRIRNHTNQNLD